MIITQIFEEKPEDAVCHKIHTKIVLEVFFYYKIQADCAADETTNKSQPTIEMKSGRRIFNIIIYGLEQSR